MSTEQETPLSELKKRVVYNLPARNFDRGVWDGEGRFIGIRNKFGHEFLACELHNDLDKHFGTARAYGEIGELPENIQPLSCFEPITKDGVFYHNPNRELFDFLKQLKA